MEGKGKDDSQLPSEMDISPLTMHIDPLPDRPLVHRIAVERIQEGEPLDKVPRRRSDGVVARQVPTRVEGDDPWEGLEVSREVRRRRRHGRIWGWWWRGEEHRHRDGPWAIGCLLSGGLDERVCVEVEEGVGLVGRSKGQS